jgi:hypothetical protein
MSISISFDLFYSLVVTMTICTDVAWVIVRRYILVYTISIIPLAPQTSGNGGPNYIHCVQTRGFVGFVNTLRMNILTCAQPKTSGSWTTVVYSLGAWID